jgi:3-oxoacyl-(acyl-carrier-protein) synthase
MKLHIVAAGVSRGQDLSRFQRDPDFRKATPNMIMGYAALDGVVKKFPKLDTASFVLGSSFGELQTTESFLSTLTKQGLARPLLFQNSLYNATIGFLALKLGATGPSVSVSNRYFTGESCLETASILIDSGAQLCIALAVETRVSTLEPALLHNYSQNSSKETVLDEGAAAVLLANEKTAQELGMETLGIIESVEYHQHGGGPVAGPYYDSNAIECILNTLNESGPNGKLPSELILSKPDGSFSKIRLSRAK